MDAAPAPVGPLSPSLAAIKASAVLSAAKRLGQVKDTLGEFHKKGGFVGWLHGDEGDARALDSVEGEEKGTEEQTEDEDQGVSFALAYSPTKPNREAIDAFPLTAARLWASTKPSGPPVDPLPTEREDEDDGLHTPPSPRSASASPDKAAAVGSSGPPSGPPSVLESLFDKVKVSTARTNVGSSSPRLSLQPRPRRQPTSRAADALASGFDDFFFRDRQRAASDTPWRPKPRQSPSSRAPPLALVGKARSAPLDAQPDEAEDGRTLDDYLGDPKLAAEVVSTQLPGDGALLTLLFAVEEFDALATLPTASEQAEASARALLHTLVALRDGSDQPRSVRAGPRTLAVLSRLALPTAADVEALERTAQLAGGGLALSPAVSTLFRAVHAGVYAELEAAVARQRPEPSERARQAADRRDSALRLLDALLEDEWASAVLWAFLFQTARHQRLSLLMDFRARLEPLLATGDLPQLATRLDALAAKFLLRTAPVALPTASIDAARLKAAALTRVTRLAVRSDSDEAAQARVLSAMEGVRALAAAVRAELAADEQLAAFSSSALFREFVSGPSVPRGDVVRLLRAARVPFHQAPKRTEQLRDRLAEHAAARHAQAVNGSQDGDGDCGLIFRVLAFERRQAGGPDSGRTTFVDLLERCSGQPGESNGNTEDTARLRTIEGFLWPEAAPNTLAMDDNSAQRRLAFHFVAGAGDDTLYGAAVRVPVRLLTGEGGRIEVATQGVCVLSRAPLVDSLRRFLGALWRRLDVPDASVLTAEIPSERLVDADADCVREALAEAHEALNAFIDGRYAPADLATGAPEVEIGNPPPTLDVQLCELFDCLSADHVVRAFGCLLTEKKLVMVASSWSLLVAAGEALRSLLWPLAWSHVFAPVLPRALRGYLQCPSPFLFGLHASYARESDLPSDVVVVDLDRDVVTGPQGFEDVDRALSGLRDTLLALCRPQVFTRDDIDSEGGASDFVREFPEREVRLAFHCHVESMLATLETTTFRFESSVGGDDAARAVVAVVEGPQEGRQGFEQGESSDTRLLAALRRSQAFSTHVCRPNV